MVISGKSLSVRAVLISILGFGLLLRAIYLPRINPKIDGLSARMALTALDISNGIHHFPYSPFQFEFDETGTTYLAYPFVRFFGMHFSAFQWFAVLSGTITLALVILITYVAAGFPAAVSAGLLFASLPCVLYWNRFVFMAGVDWITNFSFLAIICVILPGRLTVLRAMAAGFFLGAGMYIGAFTALAWPALAWLIWDKSRQQRGKNRFKPFILLGAACFVYLVLVLPLISHQIHDPYYLLWRHRHFASDQHITSFRQWIKNIPVLWMELGYKTRWFLKIPSGVALLNPLIILLVIRGAILGIRGDFRGISRVSLIYFATWSAVMGFTRQEPFQGTYFSALVPYLIIPAAIACSDIYGKLMRRFGRRSITTVLLVICLLCITAWNIREFFAGDFKLHNPEAQLDRLGKDIATQPDIPFFFSRRIPDVLYFHFPFWYVTRSALHRVAIFDWKDGHLVLIPKQTPIPFEPDAHSRCAFVIAPGDVTQFSACLPAGTLITKKETLVHSGFLKVECRLNPRMPDGFWKKSVIPPLITD